MSFAKPSKRSKPSPADSEKTHKLSLKGSAKLVSEFFEFSIHTILFQRGVYPAEDFTPVKKYGLNMLISSDDEVKAYIKKIMSQLSKWTVGGKISRLVIVITSKETGENLERWQFDVQLLGKAGEKQARVLATENVGVGIGIGENGVVGSSHEKPVEKSEKEIQEEIQSLFRQITASVTFLPMLDGRCTFNVLVYADGDAEVPMEWGDSDSREIKGGEKVALRSWGTSSHRVDTLVSYRLAD